MNIPPLIPTTASSDCKFNCPKCGQRISAPSKSAGSLGQCPTCKETFSIPKDYLQTDKNYGSTFPLSPRLFVGATVFGAALIVILLVLVVQNARLRASDANASTGPANAALANQSTDNPGGRATAAKVERLEQELGRWKQELVTVTSDQSRYNREVNDYVMDHKMAVAAIAAGVAGASVMLDDSKSTTDGQRAVGTVSAAIAVIWAINNREEVSEVANEIAKIKVAQSGYKKQIDEIGVEIKSLEKQLDTVHR